ncbi:hypothetical protein HELRODRAFT_167893 [Helobdella robusta]|uniref:Uncharacterized protein n=1 Tax=Helobdella robusta TaxID=6412 RepID=T1EZX6_HELRO|nr:hypothetical protein HELRODRAFT_167893 [Helobdella robusta]ESO10049.1 hypothetical protein HELRODRAFT_167893 [Helobdella robusta]
MINKRNDQLSQAARTLNEPLKLNVIKIKKRQNKGRISKTKALEKRKCACRQASTNVRNKWKRVVVSNTKASDSNWNNINNAVNTLRGNSKLAADVYKRNRKN